MTLKAIQLAALRADLSPMERLRRGMIEQAPPTPQEAIEGGAAYEGGVPYSSNPYAAGTKQHEDWCWGYEETQYYTEYLATSENFVYE